MSQPSPWQEPAAHVLPLLASDPATAFAHLDSLTNPDQPHGWILVFRGVAHRLYWQHNALPEYVRVSTEVIRRLEAALAASEEPAPPEALVRPLGGECYNLAAFAWSGWGRPGVTVDPESLAAGAAAAQKCLAICIDPAHGHVQFGYTPSTAHWVVGAYALAAGDYAAAREQFAQSHALDLAAGEHGLFRAGYAALAALLLHPADPDATQAFNAILDQLAAHTDKISRRYHERLLTTQRICTDFQSPQAVTAPPSAPSGTVIDGTADEPQASEISGARTQPPAR